MRILYVSPRQAWPAASGAKLRDYHFARALGGRSELTYVYYPEHGLAPLSAADLPFARRIVSVPRPRAYSAGRLARGIAGRAPLTVLNYRSAEMDRTLAGLISESRFDVVHFEATQLAPYGRLAERLGRGAQVTFDWHNIESELMRRYADSAAGGLRRIYAGVTASRMAAVERELLDSRAGHVVCSARELSELRGLAPAARLAVVENGVDVASFPAWCDEPSPGGRASGPRRILFVGLMAYHANAEAAIWFAHDVWPTLRERFGDLCLQIVGAQPGEAVRALAREPGVEVTGTVPDVKPYYRGAWAVAVPLRTGGGTRLKILEAMAAGAPVISSRIGAEGLAVVPGEHFLQAESPDDWVAALAALESAPARRDLISNARALAERRYDWGIAGERLWEALALWIGQNRS